MFFTRTCSVDVPVQTEKDTDTHTHMLFASQPTTRRKCAIINVLQLCVQVRIRAPSERPFARHTYAHVALFILLQSAHLRAELHYRSRVSSLCGCASARGTPREQTQSHFTNDAHNRQRRFLGRYTCKCLQSTHISGTHSWIRGLCGPLKTPYMCTRARSSRNLAASHHLLTPSVIMMSVRINAPGARPCVRRRHTLASLAPLAGCRRRYQCTSTTIIYIL